MQTDLETIEDALPEIRKYQRYCCSDAIFGWDKISFPFFLFVHLF